MNKLLRNILRYLAFAGAGVALLYFTYRDIDLAELWSRISKANFLWVGISFVLGYLAIVSRGMRWNLLLQPLGHQARTLNCINAVNFGYFANTFLPRSGEVARCVALNQTDEVPVDQLFGTVIMERIVDFCMLFLFLTVAILTHMDAFAQLMSQAELSFSAGKLMLVAAVGFGVLGLVYVFRKPLLRMTLVQKLVGFLKGMLDGLKSIFKMKKVSLFLFHTFFIWIMYYLTAYLVFFAITETMELSMLNGLFIVVAGGLGMVFPSPGGTGSYQFAVKMGFIALGLSAEDGITFGTIVWVTQTAMIVLTGFVAFLLLGHFRRKNAKLKLSNYVANS